jgi:hypothetical protein
MKGKLRTLTIVCNVSILAATLACTKKTEQASSSTGGGTTSTAPSGEQAARHNMALVRFVNATAGQNVDLWFGDTKIFSNIAYKAATPYRETPSERHDFILEPAGTQPATNAGVKNSEGLSDHAHYTVVAMLDKDGKQKLDVINDKLAEPANGRAKIRVINAAAEEVDVLSPVDRKEGSADRMRTYPQTPPAVAPAPAESSVDRNLDKWFGGVNKDSSTSYKDVDPVGTTLEVRPSSGVTHKRETAGPAVKVPVDFAAGKLYTLIVTGGGRGHALDVVTITDELTGTPSPTDKRS